MRRKMITAAAALALGLASCQLIPPPSVDETAGETGTQVFAVRYLEEEEAKFLTIINGYRTGQNPPLPALTSSATINQAAYDYSVVMSETGWFEHTGPDGSSPWDRMCAGGHTPACDGSAIMGENIAAGYTTAEAVFEAWRTSPGHNANMLTPEFLAIGIGLANVEGGLQGHAWTTDFSSVVDVDGCACREGEEEACESETCGSGIRTCLGLCQWGECGPPNPGVDVCDGYDNNCNGEVDEGDVCHGCEPELEVCDDEDNDCDGLVDEEGVCGNGCEPLEETCDANDNDCDGVVDEGCACPDGSPERTCGLDAGICRAGMQRCEGGAWSECAGALAPRLEICDGQDNDCDGAVDERACGIDDDGDDGGGKGGCAVAAGEGTDGAPAFVLVLLMGLALLRPRGRRGALLVAAGLLVAAAGCSESTPKKDAGDDVVAEEIVPELEEEQAGEPEEDVAADEAGDDVAAEDPAQEEAPPDLVEEDAPGDEVEPTDLPFGASCTADRQCESGLCLPPQLGGKCTETCGDEQECDFGHPGTSCTPFGRDTDGNSLSDTVVTACAGRPTGSKPAGQRCAAPEECDTRLCLEGGMCMNVCSGDADCDAIAVCLARPFTLDEGEGSYSSCGFNPVGSITLEEADYGTFSLVTEAAAGRMKQVFVPSDAVSLTITGIQTAPAQAAMVGFFEVTDPTAVEIYDMNDFFDGLDPLNWHSPWIRMGIFMVPITPRVTFMGGAYDFLPVTARFSASDPVITVTTEFTIQVKRSPSGTISSGTLQVNFFFVGLDAISAANAQTPGGEFQQVVSWLRSIYAAAAISLGTLTYTDIPEPDRSTYRILHVDNTSPDLGELAGLFSLSAGRTERAVNVFLVHDIDESGVLGISPGIPGPQGMHGTGASGVAVNYDGCWDTRSAGMVIAHEVGHYLGLFHSTEQTADPYSGDPIADTSHGDASNLMHWQWGGDNLTAGQTFVMLRAALVQ